MDRPPKESKYEPLPRWGHASVAVGTKIYVWGGRLEDFSDDGKKKLAKVVEIYSTATELWEQKNTKGNSPPGLYNNAHTSLGKYLYVYGGWDGTTAHNALHQFNTTTLTWKEMTGKNPTEAPMKMTGCGLVANGNHKLVLFGGYGLPAQSSKTGVNFFMKPGSGEKGWSNELKEYDIDAGTWTTRTCTGTCPPPCVDFTLTAIDDHRAILYGGYQPETGTVSDTFLLDMEQWHWSKLGENSSEGSSSPDSDRMPHLWPEARDGHVACLLSSPSSSSSSSSPQLLVSGGWNKSYKPVKDAWVLDVDSETWKEFTLPELVGFRFWHSVVCVHPSIRLCLLVMFGGCPGAPTDPTSGDPWDKISNTCVLELAHVDSIAPPLVDPAALVARDDWLVLEARDFPQLGDPVGRMRERVLFAEFRAVRAEKILEQILKKLDHVPRVLSHSPTPLEGVDGTAPYPTAEEEKESQPFWAVPKHEVEFTGQEVGRGRWGVVRVASFRGQQVAAKCLFNTISSEDNRQSFIESMDVAAKLRHPNLLMFMGAVLQGEPILLTELMPYNLRMVLEKDALLYHQIVGIGADVANGLTYLHSNRPDPVVHGDLTHNSVLLERSHGNRWRAKLSDFMTAQFFKQLLFASTSDISIQSDHSRSLSPPPVTAPRQTSPGPNARTSPLRKRSSLTMMEPPKSIMGKLSRKVSIQAPDIADSAALTPKRDVYCFGLLLVQMCTRSSPLDVSLMYLIQSITWQDVSTVVKLCIETNPEDRPDMADIAPQMQRMAGSISPRSPRP